MRNQRDFSMRPTSRDRAFPAGSSPGVERNLTEEIWPKGEFGNPVSAGNQESTGYRGPWDARGIRPKGSGEDVCGKEGVVKGARILLVDDEKHHAMEWARRLTLRGYVVAAVTGTETARATMAQVAYDVIVVGMRHSDTDGLQTLREIRRTDPTPETLFVSRDGSMDSIREALRLGAYDGLAPPMEVGDLEEMIEHAWDSRRREQARELENVFFAGMRPQMEPAIDGYSNPSSVRRSADEAVL